MAGVKGRSGGARNNAGRKKKETLPPTPPVPIDDCDMLKMLQDVALGRVDATALQVRAAIAAVQYTHTKKSDGGKKDEQADKAKQAAAGKFAASTPPRLVVSNRK